MTSVSVEELRSGLAAVLDRVAAGDDVEITRYGKPIAHLIGAPPLRVLGQGRGSVLHFDEFTAAEIDEMLDGPIFP